MKTFKLIFKNFWFISVILTTVILVNLFLFRISFTIGDSMAPTLSNGDIVLTQITKDVERYDIVVFEHEDNYLIKRVIGCPGETIQIIDNTIYINEKPIKDSVNIIMEDYGTANKPITLKENEYFVMGDNRNYSMDSREFGPIEKETILGRKIK